MDTYFYLFFYGEKKKRPIEIYGPFLLLDDALDNIGEAIDKLTIEFSCMEVNECIIQNSEPKIIRTTQRIYAKS